MYVQVVYQNNAPLRLPGYGETEAFYCALEDGDYSLEVTDPTTGCTNIYTEGI